MLRASCVISQAFVQPIPEGAGINAASRGARPRPRVKLAKLWLIRQTPAFNRLNLPLKWENSTFNFSGEREISFRIIFVLKQRRIFVFKKKKKRKFPFPTNIELRSNFFKEISLSRISIYSNFLFLKKTRTGGKFRCLDFLFHFRKIELFVIIHGASTVGIYATRRFLQLETNVSNDPPPPSRGKGPVTESGCKLVCSELQFN